jgi:hypothetical protein
LLVVDASIDFHFILWPVHQGGLKKMIAFSFMFPTPLFLPFTNVAYHDPGQHLISALICRPITDGGGEMEGN